MPYVNAHALVEADWLEAHIDNPKITILDASWHMPNLNRDAKAEYKEKHIPGAIFFDIDVVSDGTSDLPHMLPSSDGFARTVSKMGISNEDLIVVYDSYGLFSAARVWWMFRCFGHDKVAILNGGSLKWEAENRPMDNKFPTRQPTNYTADFKSELVKSLSDVQVNLESMQAQVIDARARNRFHAEIPEPRPGLRGGHIPGSLNLPFAEILTEAKTIKDEASIRALFETEKLDFDKPVIASCGTGVTACVLSFALYLIGKEDAAVYDGSWTEWGGHRETPIEP
ncbi:3-mercaptopyruvate sulfurtransferase [Curvivirga aplysinae]|uniref:3-mercaptopyruvate sulfurtransferase n=1 Tax=Curvivirga aplysinae TaxID=2529852 RepID=UPI0012BB4F3E|nr:3-mercaptopyruvate sulfurtransferase [Curvivirga aplysinae]MTI09814.1 3-mercaptopyruvate sulfurtransferase [Curvivirga aplysinae]